MSGTEAGETQPVDREAEKARLIRRTRVNRLIGEAWDIAYEACDEHIWSKGKRLAGECILYSGGNDSTILTHLFKGSADFAVHINTGIGIEDTRQFVRDTCKAWDLPLIEERGDSYRDLVIAHGFPGPAHHFKMYQRLKERGLRKVRNRLVKHPYRERVLFIAGRRRQESERRKDIPKHERDGSIVWASPLVSWTDEDMATYREMFPDVPRNPVSDHLHMSGECLCGAFAKPNELDEVGFFYPDVAVEIRGLEAEVAAAGNVPPARCRWGWGSDKEARKRDAAPKAGWRTYEYCATCGKDQGTDIDDHPEGGGTIDHPWNGVEERIWWDPAAKPTLFDDIETGPLCSTCTLWTEDENVIATSADSGSNRQVSK